MLQFAPSPAPTPVSLDYHQYDSSSSFKPKEKLTKNPEINQTTQNLKSQTQIFAPPNVTSQAAVTSTETKMEVEETAEVSETPIVKGRKKTASGVEKRVRFKEEAKSWDGLDKFNSDFDDLLFCFLVKGQSVGDGDVLQWTGEDSQRIFSLCSLLNDLLIRLQEVEPEVQVPCLPRGGGRAIRVEKVFEPYLLSLLSVLATALSICVGSPRKQNFEVISKSAENSKMMEHLIRNKADAKALIYKVQVPEIADCQSKVVVETGAQVDSVETCEESLNSNPVVAVNNVEMEVIEIEHETVGQRD